LIDLLYKSVSSSILGFHPVLFITFGFFFLSVLTFALHFRNFNANYDNNSKIKKKRKKKNYQNNAD